MFCPSCSEYITENNLIKSKVKKWEDTDIEYVARCPLCNVTIGKMFWGKLTLSPELRERQPGSARPDVEGASAPPSPPRTEEPYIYPPPSGDASDPFREDRGAYPEENDSSQDDAYTQARQYDEPVYSLDQLSGHYCPYCGGDLPHDANLLPRRFQPR